MMTRSVAALLAQLGPLERLDDAERLDEHKLLDGLERDDDNEHRRLDRLDKGVVALLVCLDKGVVALLVRLERLDGLGCLAQLL